MSEIRNKVSKHILNIINDENITKEIEKGIYNYTIIESEKIILLNLGIINYF